MLDEQDLQAIGALLDQKLKIQAEIFDSKIKEVLFATNEGFSNMQIQINVIKEEVRVLKEDVGVLKEDVRVLKEDVKVLKEDVRVLKEDVRVLKEDVRVLKADMQEVKQELEKRPTKNEIFSWADRRIVDLEIAKERHDYLHLDELEKLPPPAEINRALIERGFKEKLA